MGYVTNNPSRIVGGHGLWEIREDLAAWEERR